MRKVRQGIARLLLIAILFLTACSTAPKQEDNADRELQKQEEYGNGTAADTAEASQQEADDTVFLTDNIPPYEGSAYIEINGNVPSFTEEELVTESYEYYSELDELGRCGTCTASIGTDIMPTEEYGSIGSVKPTGWHTIKYAGIVDGNYLYNRCHLIGFQLTGENANVKNLITGTRYLNIEGMLPFENRVAAYVKETGNHVMYRVTPVFEGDNLLASGVRLEGKSVEDDGKGISFHVYCYNVQPGITIDYATGDSMPAETVEPQPGEDGENFQDGANTQTAEYPYVVNGKNGKIHVAGACPATGSDNSAMSDPHFFKTYEEAEAYSFLIAPNLEKRKCGNCR